MAYSRTKDPQRLRQRPIKIIYCDFFNFPFQSSFQSSLPTVLTALTIIHPIKGRKNLRRNPPGSKLAFINSATLHNSSHSRILYSPLLLLTLKREMTLSRVTEIKIHWYDSIDPQKTIITYRYEVLGAPPKSHHITPHTEKNTAIHHLSCTWCSESIMTVSSLAVTCLIRTSRIRKKNNRKSKCATMSLDPTHDEKGSV